MTYEQNLASVESLSAEGIASLMTTQDDDLAEASVVIGRFLESEKRIMAALNDIIRSNMISSCAVCREATSIAQAALDHLNGKT